MQMKRTNGKSNSQVEGCGAYGCFSSRGLGGEKCTALGREYVFQEAHGAEKNEPNEQRSDRSEQSEVNRSFSLRLGVRKVIFLMQNAVG